MGIIEKIHSAVIDFRENDPRGISPNILYITPEQEYDMLSYVGYVFSESKEDSYIFGMKIIVDYRINDIQLRYIKDNKI